MKYVDILGEITHIPNGLKLHDCYITERLVLVNFVNINALRHYTFMTLFDAYFDKLFPNARPEESFGVYYNSYQSTETGLSILIRSQFIEMQKFEEFYSDFKNEEIPSIESVHNSNVHDVVVLSIDDNGEMTETNRIRTSNSDGIALDFEHMDAHSIAYAYDWIMRRDGNWEWKGLLSTKRMLICRYFQEPSFDFKLYRVAYNVEEDDIIPHTYIDDEDDLIYSQD